MPFITVRSEFDFKPLGEGLVQLQGKLEYQDYKCGTITVPDGFKFDLASYPRLARPFFDRLGKSMRSACVHDYLYEQKPKGIKKSDADRIFREALKQDSASGLQRWSSWLGVAIGGWWAWLT